MAKKNGKAHQLEFIAKSPTGINGLDEITYGGLPKGRPTLVCGNPGSGKSLFASEFLLHGAREYNEPGLLVSFEESESEIIKNVASLGFDFKKLIAQKKLAINHIYINRDDFDEVGAYNLDGIFIQLNHIVKNLKIKRIVIDTIEVLFGNFADQSILRTEVQRLFRWIKENNLTAIITAEAGRNSLSRYGLEEYVADCVILLDNRLEQQVSTRRLRIIKYRGSNHSTNEYPFLIGKNGILVLPISTLHLAYRASNQRVSSGIKHLDTMFGGKGYYRGSSILISGVAGSGKTSFAAAFANSVCKEGQRCLYFAFEESISQMKRNMKSIGIDLGYWIKKNLLYIHSEQPYSHSIEGHLVAMFDLIEKINPHAVIIDPISNLKEIGNAKEVKAFFARLIDYLKMKQITILSTSLVSENIYSHQNKDNVSSLMDTWILLQNIVDNGKLNRGIMILKSRGMKHSNQLGQMILSPQGINLIDVQTGRIAHKANGGMDLAIAQDSLSKIRKTKTLSDISNLQMADVSNSRTRIKPRSAKK